MAAFVLKNRIDNISTMVDQKRAETAFEESVDYIDAVSLNDLLDSSPPQKDNVYDVALGRMPVFNQSVDYLDTRPEEQQPLNNPNVVLLN